MTPGKLKAIWIKRGHGAPMDAVAQAELIEGQGIVGNADQGRRRQVTIIEEEVWNDVMAELGGSLDPSSRRANLMVEGIRLARTHGKTLKIGDCKIRIYNETAPCYQMDELLPGLQTALRPDWRGGAFGEVMNDAEIHVGDAVTWEDAE